MSLTQLYSECRQNVSSIQLAGIPEGTFTKLHA